MDAQAFVAALSCEERVKLLAALQAEVTERAVEDSEVEQFRAEVDAIPFTAEHIAPHMSVPDYIRFLVNQTPGISHWDLRKAVLKAHPGRNTYISCLLSNMKYRTGQYSRVETGFTYEDGCYFPNN